MNFDGGDLIKNDDFQKGKMVAVRRFLNTSSIFDGGDLMTNDDFQEGKIVNSWVNTTKINPPC